MGRSPPNLAQGHKNNKSWGSVERRFPYSYTLWNRAIGLRLLRSPADGDPWSQVNTMNSEALTALLRTYDASLDANSVKALYEDEERRVAIESWSRLHLTPDTLISVDELEQ